MADEVRSQSNERHRVAEPTHSVCSEFVHSEWLGGDHVEGDKRSYAGQHSALNEVIITR